MKETYEKFYKPTSDEHKYLNEIYEKYKALPTTIVINEGTDDEYLFVREMDMGYFPITLVSREDFRAVGYNADNYTMSKVNILKESFIKTIKDTLKAHDIEVFHWSDLDEGSSPIVQEDEFDENNTYTLDTIEEDGIWASNCCDSHFWSFENTPIEVLENICEELENID